ncbi:helix-turn-helix domain-containing protein [Streptomyces hirsutus]|uniref:hypothetical protein n=1 Tax=Streptomyces hirsutus TaxID=35620 RepID=UPI0038630F10|nr:helix-turn-helix domain-containing protein [Streptomyces hirsutus]
MVQQRLGIGRSRFFELIKSGELRSVRIGVSRLVSEYAIQDFIRRLELEQNGVEIPAEQNGDGAAGATAAPSENPVSIA